MRYLALASDYDDTIAQGGVVTRETRKALERFLDSGRHLILVTGRLLDDLGHVFPGLDLFERVVAENGAVLYDPRTQRQRLLADPVSQEFVQDLQQRGLPDIEVGQAIVATWRLYEAEVRESIRTLGLDKQLIFNKDSLMIAPAGVDKCTGLTHALNELELSCRLVIAVGDAENDLPLLACAGCAVAVANAVPELKQRAHWVTSAGRGEGVTELIEAVLADDLASLSPGNRRP